MKAICVYSSSSDAVDPCFFDAARELGAEIARCGHVLIYGGARVGLMGAVARSVHERGGTVVGVLPSAIRDRELAYEAADELIITTDLRERKAIMESRADVFIGLPGGFGTLEELMEILTLKQLHIVTKPVILLNTGEFYDPLIHLFEHMCRHRFIRPEARDLYYLAADVPAVFSYLETYRPPKVVDKWLRTATTAVE